MERLGASGSLQNLGGRSNLRCRWTVEPLVFDGGTSTHASTAQSMRFLRTKIGGGLRRGADVTRRRPRGEAKAKHPSRSNRGALELPPNRTARWMHWIRTVNRPGDEGVLHLQVAGHFVHHLPVSAGRRGWREGGARRWFGWVDVFFQVVCKVVAKRIGEWYRI